ncbi:MAG: hypothetical protein H0W15_04415 [Gemmatimonadales bacterium]|nr:hypothetical protein [Gemmatimonadales bacterium]
MFESIFGLVKIALMIGIGLFAFSIARGYVRSRLRFVDAVRNPLAPWIVGVGAWIVAVPVAALLPLITGATALAFGLASGLGTASGVKALKRGE